MIEDARGEAGEAKRSAPPRKRGLGRGLGAILSTPDAAEGADGDGAHQTHHDPLTGLPNRALLDVRLEHALAACQQDDAVLAVLLVALDGFSKVNELFGHRVGDDLLHGVAERMSAARRRSDTVARFAGDEFVVVCPYVGTTELACLLAERVLEDVSRPCSVEGVEHHLTASIGVVVTAPGDAPEDTEMLETLLGDAVLAMRTAKEDGGASWRLFDPTMRADAADRYRYRQDLRAAMENGELVLEYEQIVDLASRRAVGQSARPGWQRSGLGDGPEALLDVVDDAGLALPVGRWVLDEALSGLAARRKTSGVPADFRVWVKVSPSFAIDPALAEAVDELTATHGIPAAMLGLDITEPSALSLAAAAPALDALAGRGIALMLDDFGASPSNLAQLQRLPITGLKLAPEVVAGLDDADDTPGGGALDDAVPPGPDVAVPPGPDGAALVRGLVGLGRALGLTVVAQGVTSEFQAATLRALGCDLAQGPFLENAPVVESGIGTMPGSRRRPVATGLRPVPDQHDHVAGPTDDPNNEGEPDQIDTADEVRPPDDLRARDELRAADDLSAADDPNREHESARRPAPEALWATGRTDLTDMPDQTVMPAPAPAQEEPAAPSEENLAAPIPFAPSDAPDPSDGGAQEGRERRGSPSHPARLRRLP